MLHKHGKALGGGISVGSSRGTEGRYGRLFAALPAAGYGRGEQETVAHLRALGSAMGEGFDAPKDGADETESAVPALYTYLAQFIAHDLTFEPASSLQRHNDPDALTDYRTPAFDLDGVYGGGGDGQPYLYEGEAFLLGESIEGGSAGARDLPRTTDPACCAIIPDVRNDENVITSQLHGLFLRFHNRLRAERPALSFEAIQQQVRFHYQYIVLNDFLPRLIEANTLADLKSAGAYSRSNLRLCNWADAPFLPIEFLGAVYHFGHSMIRPGYRLNDQILLPLTAVPSLDLPAGIVRSGGEMPSDWGIDWARFIDTEIRNSAGSADRKSERLQFAHQIGTQLVQPLANLPLSVESRRSSLAVCTLLRGWQLGLPSGQEVARAMGLPPLNDNDILIGQVGERPRSIIDPAGGTSSFAGNCPLWTYILAEAMHYPYSVRPPVKEEIAMPTNRLGPVGGRIVAEVFLGLMFADSHSVLNADPHWVPRQGPKYALKDFVNYAIGRGTSFATT